MVPNSQISHLHHLQCWQNSSITATSTPRCCCGSTMMIHFHPDRKHNNDNSISHKVWVLEKRQECSLLGCSHYKMPGSFKTLIQLFNFHELHFLWQLKSVLFRKLPNLPCPLSFKVHLHLQYMMDTPLWTNGLVTLRHTPSIRSWILIDTWRFGNF